MASVRMLRHMIGYPDGYTRRDYAPGRVYDIAEPLLTAFFDEGAVEMVEAETKPAKAPANKARRRAPKNKAAE